MVLIPGFIILINTMSATLSIKENYLKSRYVI